MEVTDMLDEFPGHNGMIENMQKTLKIAGPLLRKANKKRKIHFKENDRVGVIFEKFISLMDGIRGFDRGHSFDFEDGKFKLKMHYYNPVYDHTSYIMPLDWLPKMKAKNIKLHNIIVDTIRYFVHDKLGYVAWEEDFYDIDEWMSESLNYLDAYEPKDKLTYNRREVQIDNYEKNFPYYKDLINDRYTNLPALIRRIKSFVGLCPIEMQFIDWCKELIDISYEPGDMNSFISASIDQFMIDNDCTEDTFGQDGYPLSPDQWIRFMWLDDEDYIKSFNEWMGDTAGNFGVLEYHARFECNTQKELLESYDKFIAECGIFPTRFAKCLEHGYLLVGELDDYFNNRMIQHFKDGKRTESRTLYSA